MSEVIQHGVIIRTNEDGLDEVFATEVTVHLERMDQGSWWMGIRTKDGHDLRIGLGAKRPGVTIVTGIAEWDS